MTFRPNDKVIWTIKFDHAPWMATQHATVILQATWEEHSSGGVPISSETWVCILPENSNHTRWVPRRELSLIRP